METSHIASCPWIPIPDKRIICIEHPAIINNLDKGVATLGGEDNLASVSAPARACPHLTSIFRL